MVVVRNESRNPRGNPCTCGPCPAYIDIPRFSNLRDIHLNFTYLGNFWYSIINLSVMSPAIIFSKQSEPTQVTWLQPSKKPKFGLRSWGSLVGCLASRHRRATSSRWDVRFYLKGLCQWIISCCLSSWSNLHIRGIVSENFQYWTPSTPWRITVASLFQNQLQIYASQIAGRLFLYTFMCVPSRDASFTASFL